MKPLAHWGGDMKFKCSDCKKEFIPDIAVPPGTKVIQECPYCGSMRTAIMREATDEKGSELKNDNNDD